MPGTSASTSRTCKAFHPTDATRHCRTSTAFCAPFTTPGRTDDSSTGRTTNQPASTIRQVRHRPAAEYFTIFSRMVDSRSMYSTTRTQQAQCGTKANAFGDPPGGLGAAQTRQGARPLGSPYVSGNERGRMHALSGHASGHFHFPKRVGSKKGKLCFDFPRVLFFDSEIFRFSTSPCAAKQTGQIPSPLAGGGESKNSGDAGGMSRSCGWRPSRARGRD